MLRTSLKKRAALIGLSAVMALLAFTVTGCGKNPTAYTDPSSSITTTLTPTSLIDVATLKQWVDEGKLNNNAPTARDRIVIVDVTTAAGYAAAHIPGSVLWNNSTEVGAARLEALGALTSEVPTGSMMDSYLQRWGVDKNTTIVITMGAPSNGGSGTAGPRAYFTLRYWGFPRERIKLLNGGDSLWVAGGNTLTAVVPSVRRSTMSVRDNYTGSTACLSMRTAIGDMINVVDGMNLGAIDTSATGTVLLDVRGGSNPSYMMNSRVDDYNQYLVSGFPEAIKPVSDITARFASFGVTSSTKLTYVTCASGHRASTSFFILDGILHWPVSLYDGSSGQWTAYRTANGVAAAWRLDANSPGTSRARSWGTLSGTLVLDATANAIYTSITDPRANQIFQEDKIYLTTGQTTGGSNTGGGGGGGGTPSGC
jgi:3-mercaptopyruvate sulfurtransferase SseA